MHFGDLAWVAQRIFYCASTTSSIERAWLVGKNVLRKNQNKLLNQNAVAKLGAAVNSKLLRGIRKGFEKPDADPLTEV